MTFRRFLSDKLANWLLLISLSLVAGSLFADVRILLDVSKSMAENDPQNHRTEALLSLTDAIPSGEKAGVWTFGQYVNLLVPHRPVDSAWRRDTTVKLRQQGAPAIRTNMGRVLEDAAYDFNFSSYTGSADIILISDGKVDIAPNEEVNAVERERILSQLVPRYKSANARIHTIAISDNADTDLLQRLSAQTGGRYQSVTDTARLNRSLATLTAIIAPQAQRLALKNYFDVDADLKTLTVWVAHDSGAIALVDPEGVQTSAVKPAGQQWQVGSGYSQVTLANPQSGRWQLKGALDSNAKVLVYGDVRLDWSVPEQDQVIAGQAVQLRARMLARGGNELAPEMYQHLSVRLLVDGRQSAVRIEDDHINARILPSAAGEMADIQLLVDGGTFSLSSNRKIEFIEPFLSELLPLAEAFEWRLYLNPLLADSDEMTISAEYEIDGERFAVQFERRDGLYWFWQLPYDSKPGAYQLYLDGSLTNDGSMMILPQQQLTVTVPPANRAAMAEADAETGNMAAAMNAEFVKDPMPEFEELQADIVVDQGAQWSDEVELVPEAESDGQMGTYMLLTLPAILFLVIAYLFYRRLEQKATPNEAEDDLILGGDEFAALDDIRTMTPDADLDLAMLDDEDDGLDSIPVMEPMQIDDYEDDLPTPNRTEAPSPAQEDMLAEQSDNPLDQVEPEPEPDTEEDPEEELFDISSIDDDLADLDLALDGDDPFAEADDKN